MRSVIKNRLREIVPVHYQVPIKYFVNALCGQLEVELKLLRWIVPRDSRVIDVGGNRGSYVYHLWRLGADVQVFEPNPDCSRVLSAWAVAKPRVHVHGVALSDQPGTATLHIPQDDAGIEHDASASLVHVDFPSARQVPVELRTLDSFGFADIGFIKIDVEGHESDVLQGARLTLQDSRPALLIEIEQRHNSRPIAEIFDWLSSDGYQGFYLDFGQLQPVSHFNLERDQSSAQFGLKRGRYLNNFLFLHDRRLDRGEYAQLMEKYAL